MLQFWPQDVRFFRLALPNHEHVVLAFLESGDGPRISRYVCVELGYPKLAISAGRRGPFASFVTVPKAPVDEHRPVTRPIRNVGRARKIAVVGAKSSPKRVKFMAHGKLGSGSMLTNPAHAN